MTITVKVEQEISEQRMIDLICTGLEGGMTSSWLHLWEKVGGPEQPDDKLVWYAQPECYDPGTLKFKVQYDDPDEEEGAGNGEQYFGYSDLVDGLQLMATKYPRHFGDFMAENDDAVTGDVYIQCVVLKEVIYG